MLGLLRSVGKEILSKWPFKGHCESLNSTCESKTTYVYVSTQPILTLEVQNTYTTETSKTRPLPRSAKDGSSVRNRILVINRRVVWRAKRNKQ
jgi:hypothetical protein